MILVPQNTHWTGLKVAPLSTCPPVLVYLALYATVIVPKTTCIRLCIYTCEYTWCAWLLGWSSIWLLVQCLTFVCWVCLSFFIVFLLYSLLWACLWFTHVCWRCRWWTWWSIYFDCGSQTLSLSIFLSTHLQFHGGASNASDILYIVINGHLKPSNQRQRFYLWT